MNYSALPRPTNAFVGASWAVLIVGTLVYLIGLWRSTMPLYEQGFYFTVLMYALFSAISLQKIIRDRLEGIPVTGLYVGLCWLSLVLSIALAGLGLWNADLLPSEKGFYAMAFLLSLFGAVTVQKNTRDLTLLDRTAALRDERSELHQNSN
jgi:uncharacterized membrane protein YiaA